MEQYSILWLSRVSGPIVFTHVPKTGGSSFHAAASGIVGAQHWFIVTGEEKLGELQSLPSNALENVAYCGGHLSFAQARTIWYPARFICSLRDAWSRVMSHFLYVIREDGFQFSPRPEQDLEGAFEHFLADCYEAGAFSNLACRTICGAADHCKAIEVIERHYSLIWTMSRIDDAWNTVAPWLYDLSEGEGEQAPGPIHRINAAPASQSTADVGLGMRPDDPEHFFSNALRERTLAANVEDQKLLSWLDSEHDGLWTARPGVRTGHRPALRRDLRLVIDGQEGSDGRGLMTISALHLSAARLRGVKIEIIDVSSRAVEIAAEALVYDEGLIVQVYTSNDSKARLVNAHLYAAIAFDGLGHLRLNEAAEHGVPCLVASQFHSGGELTLPAGGECLGRDAAHDPDCFGRQLCARLGALNAGIAKMDAT